MNPGWYEALSRHRGLVQVGPEGARSFPELLARATQWQGVFAARPEAHWGLYLENPRQFAPAWLGLLGAGKRICLLPHAGAGLLSELQHALDGFLLDEAGPGLTVPVLGPDAADGAEPGSGPFCPRPLSFFSSGSTGRGRMYTKDLAQLLGEVEVLEHLFGRDLAGSGVCASASHQHIYGFLFGFLWPLMAGRPVWTAPCAYPEDLETALAGLGRGALVSTPSLLRRLPELMDLPALAGRCVEVFSSGGPLPRAAAMAFEHGLGRAPVEVFGSTETGGVAWRRRSAASHEPPWIPFPGVRAEPDPETGRLRIASPFVHRSEAPDGAYLMQDLAEARGEGFALRGRADRIVKLEQKRVSLEELERRLAGLPEVDEAAVLVLDSGEAAGRSRLGAVLVLSPRGETRRRAEGDAALHRGLREALRAWFEPAALPRAWRQVARLPENRQGKRPLDALRALFEADPVTRPEVLEEHREPDVVTLHCRVPEDLVYFDGHFEGLPVVAGVVQIQWAMEGAAEAFGLQGTARRLEALKFQRLLFPGEVFTLELRHDQDRSRVAFALFDGPRRFSSGRVVLERRGG